MINSLPSNFKPHTTPATRPRSTNTTTSLTGRHPSTGLSSPTTSNSKRRDGSSPLLLPPYHPQTSFPAPSATTEYLPHLFTFTKHHALTLLRSLTKSLSAQPNPSKPQNSFAADDTPTWSYTPSHGCQPRRTRTHKSLADYPQSNALPQPHNSPSQHTSHHSLSLTRLFQVPHLAMVEIHGPATSLPRYTTTPSHLPVARSRTQHSPRPTPQPSNMGRLPSHTQDIG